MMGIARPDIRPPEVKAAAERIRIGYMACSDMAVFRCDECGESWGIREKHKPGCGTGRILEKWADRLYGGQYP